MTAKKLIVFSLFIIGLIVVTFDILTKAAQEQIAEERHNVLSQAKMHFQNIINMRKWNALHGGIYIKPLHGEQPNPYLKNNTLKVDENLTLIKVNPAWMTRQLSEMNDIKEYQYRLTSLNPLNPGNKADPFEAEALRYIEKHQVKSYYRFDMQKRRLDYMGALKTEKSCLACHALQGYKEGDVRGGLHVSLDLMHLIESTKRQEKLLTQRKTVILVIALVLSIFYYYLYKRSKEVEKLNITLEERVRERTQEIGETKQLFQGMLDNELSLILVMKKGAIIYANRTFLDFFSLKNLEDFLKKYGDVGALFQQDSHEKFLQKEMKGDNWVSYLLRHQGEKRCRVKFDIEGKTYIFKPYIKRISENSQTYLILFDDVTDHFNMVKSLQDAASKDALTGLANRAQFDLVLHEQIHLAVQLDTPIAILFLDIDFFKKVNDLYGHDAGDRVLKDLARIFKEHVRQIDLVARWGGEEFCIILPSTGIEHAVILAEKIRTAVENYDFEKVGRLTISAGVALYNGRETPSGLVKRADKALYEAKSSGRNCVKTAV